VAAVAPGSTTPAWPAIPFAIIAVGGLWAVFASTASLGPWRPDRLRKRLAKRAWSQAADLLEEGRPLNTTDDRLTPEYRDAVHLWISRVWMTLSETHPGLATQFGAPVDVPGGDKAQQFMRGRHKILAAIVGGLKREAGVPDA
jgi:hypothetical protein